MKIKDLPEQNRPRERFKKYGKNEFVRGNIAWP
jgi:DNA repair protein RadC